MSELFVQALNDALKYHRIPPLFYAGMAYPEFSKAIAILAWTGSVQASNTTIAEWEKILGSMGIKMEERS